MMVDSHRLAEWLQRLVKIPSVGPANAGPRSGNSSEARLAERLTTWFTELGAEVHQENVYPSRPNVYAIWRGSSDRWIAIDVHMDTVGVETMQGDPFDGRVEDGRVYGRGAVDTKASLAVLLALLEALHNTGKGIAPNLLICASSDEETGARGAAVFAEWVRRRGVILDQLLVAEPTMCGPIYGHKGSVGIELEIQGVAAHSSQPELGKNAIVAAAPLIMALDAEHKRLAALPPTTKLGSPVLTVSLIKGGQAANIVPNRCMLTIDRRIVVGENPPEVAEALYDLARQHCSLSLTMRTTHQLPAFYQQPDTPWIKQLADWSGVPSTVAPYGTNAWAYSVLTRECVVLGPGSIEQAHRDVEWVAVSELEKLANIYTRWWGLEM